MLKKLLIACTVLFLMVIIAGLVMPTSYAIEKQITIKATPDQVHALVGDLTAWPAWSPWEKEDKSIVTTPGDKTTGIGANQSWTSDQGPGELTFTKCDAHTGIAYDMAFIDGEDRYPSQCTMEYSVDGENTIVKWTMTGDMGDMMPPVIAGLITPLMKGEINRMFLMGLENLKMEIEGSGEAEADGASTEDAAAKDSGDEKAEEESK